MLRTQRCTKHQPHRSATRERGRYEDTRFFGQRPLGFIFSLLTLNGLYGEGTGRVWIHASLSPGHGLCVAVREKIAFHTTVVHTWGIRYNIIVCEFRSFSCIVRLFFLFFSCPAACQWPRACATPCTEEGLRNEGLFLLYKYNDLKMQEMTPISSIGG